MLEEISEVVRLGWALKVSCGGMGEGRREEGRGQGGTALSTGMHGKYPDVPEAVMEVGAGQPFPSQSEEETFALGQRTARLDGWGK